MKKTKFKQEEITAAREWWDDFISEVEELNKLANTLFHERYQLLLDVHKKNHELTALEFMQLNAIYTQAEQLDDFASKKFIQMSKFLGLARGSISDDIVKDAKKLASHAQISHDDEDEYEVDIDTKKEIIRAFKEMFGSKFKDNDDE